MLATPGTCLDCCCRSTFLAKPISGLDQLINRRAAPAQKNKSAEQSPVDLSGNAKTGCKVRVRRSDVYKLSETILDRRTIPLSTDRTFVSPEAGYCVSDRWRRLLSDYRVIARLLFLFWSAGSTQERSLDNVPAQHASQNGKWPRESE